MKKLIFIMLSASMLLAGCTETESTSGITADNITIFFGVSSYAMFGAKQAVIDDLLNRFNSLSFEKTTEEMDFISAFGVSFSYKGNRVKSFSVDKNGVFRLDGEAQCYRISSGSFDYEHLKEIYRDSQNAETGAYIPLREDELLTMVDEIIKPTREKPYLLASSNPYDYIDAHRDIFNRLAAGGQNTLNVFTDILKNSTEFGLDKYIMAAVCAEITGIGSGDGKSWSSAGEWLKIYNERGESS